MDLYNRTILDLNSNPPNFSARDDAQHEVKAYNSYCGDKFKLLLDYPTRAEAISFTGHGCAVSKASAAILTECVLGKSWQEIHDICVTVLEYLKSGVSDITGIDQKIADIDARLESFSVVSKYPGRYDCAALCWEEMRKYSINEHLPPDSQAAKG